MIEKLVKGAVFNIANILLQVVLGLFVFREMLHYFGEQDFGTWSLIMAILAHIALFEFGLGAMISRMVSIEDKALDNKAILSTCFVVINSIASVFIVVSTIVSFIIYEYSYDYSSFVSGESLAIVVLLLSANFCMNFASGAYQAYLVGKFYVGTVNSVRFIANLARSMLILLAIYYDLGIVSIAMVFFSVALFELICRITFSYKAGLSGEIAISCVSRSAFAYILTRAFRLIFLRMNDYTRNNSAILFSGVMLGTVAVVPLRISGRLMEIYVEISTSVNYLLTPYFSKFISNDSREMSSKFQVSILVASGLSLIIFGNMWLHAEWFLGIWLNEFSPVTLTSLKVMAIGFCVANMQGPCTALLIAKDEYQTISYLTISEMCLTLVLMPIFISQYGVLGAAYALTTSLCIARAMLQPILVSRKVSLSWRRYYGLLAAPIIVVFILFQFISLSADLVTSFSALPYFVNFITLEVALLSTVLLLIYKRVKNAS
ncbi:MATE family efflux transporter [Vibrio atypicus]|uniref:polysaccharide biosynthesis C-terminal domain-containing protein n=1 Tax=Vibrio atypicus TaxID=558271 RepID=UPI003736FF2B